MVLNILLTSFHEAGVTMKALVTGSRTWRDNQTIADTFRRFGVTAVVHGGARGADTCAHQEALRLGIVPIVYRADWATYGKAAGFIRNQAMLNTEKPDVVLAFWDGQSRGTGHMIKIAKQAGYDVIVTFVTDKARRNSQNELESRR
jgi:hypothetical protein